MPGENCCIVGCQVSGRQKNIGIFKTPFMKHAELRKYWISEIKSNGVKLLDFQLKMTVYTCEKNTLRVMI